MKNKITFKREKKATGLAGIGYPHASVEIKYNGKVCGMIYPPTWESKNNVWSVALTIEKEEPTENSMWRWFFFKKTFETETEARDFVKEIFPKFQETHKIFFYLD